MTLQTWDLETHEWREVQIHRDSVTAFCPVCGDAIDRMDSKAKVVYSNPEAVVFGIPNPYPDPMLTKTHVLWHDVTFSPCGHEARQTR